MIDVVAVLGADLEREAGVLSGVLSSTIMLFAVCGPGSATGVYIAGWYMGNETGSFFATAAAGAGTWILGRIIIGAVSFPNGFGILLAAAAISSTIVNNLTRRVVRQRSVRKRR